jgi:hypothetical protein
LREVRPVVHQRDQQGPVGIADSGHDLQASWISAAFYSATGRISYESTTGLVILWLEVAQRGGHGWDPDRRSLSHLPAVDSRQRAET